MTANKIRLFCPDCGEEDDVSEYTFTENRYGIMLWDKNVKLHVKFKKCLVL